MNHWWHLCPKVSGMMEHGPRWVYSTVNYLLLACGRDTWKFETHMEQWAEQLQKLVEMQTSFMRTNTLFWLILTGLEQQDCDKSISIMTWVWITTSANFTLSVSFSGNLLGFMCTWMGSWPEKSEAELWSSLESVLLPIWESRTRYQKHHQSNEDSVILWALAR